MSNISRTLYKLRRISSFLSISPFIHPQYLLNNPLNKACYTDAGYKFEKRIMASKTRTEIDSFGPIEVDTSRYWGAQTERSLHNCKIGHERMPLPLIHAFGLQKRAAAFVNHHLGKLD